MWQKHHISHNGDFSISLCSHTAVAENVDDYYGSRRCPVCTVLCCVCICCVFGCVICNNSYILYIKVNWNGCACISKLVGLCIFTFHGNDTSQPNTFHINYFRINEKKRKEFRYQLHNRTIVCMHVHRRYGWIVICQVHSCCIKYTHIYKKVMDKKAVQNFRFTTAMAKAFVSFHHFQTDDAFDGFCAFPVVRFTKRITLARWGSNTFPFHL